jgi:lipoprotein-anchoring transpeptidase ErfK/SrfK
LTQRRTAADPHAPAPRARGWSVFISLGRQHAYVYLNGALVKDIPVSSGARGQTPRGTFRVYSKSSLTSAEGDPSVTMRFMTRFRGGIGFHGIPRKNGRPLATPLGIRPVSHGCIRMADLNAAWIYGNVPVGSTVVVK